jgi:hypothetical protein
MRRGICVPAFAVALVLVSPGLHGRAMAATQILGLAATGGPVPLVCEDGRCAAEFSSFCLQRDRKGPNFEAQYRVGDGQDLTLVLIDDAGVERRLAAADLVTIKTARGYTAVIVSVAERDLAAFGATRAAIVVGERISLLPLPTADDPLPPEAEEIAYATGPARAVAADLFDGDDGKAGAARLLGRLINLAPARTRLSNDRRRELWRQVAGAAPDDAVGSAARHAAALFGACQRDIAEGRMFGLRDCLQGRHDELMIDLNLRYWNRLMPGS